MHKTHKIGTEALVLMYIENILVPMYNEDKLRDKSLSKKLKSFKLNRQTSTINKRKGLDVRPTQKNIIVLNVL